jgi:tetratricopeptide (TPR) repeat protein
MSDLRSLFEVQAKLAMDVANALHLTFFDVELERIERISTDSREAYELYLEGLALDGNTRFRQIIDLMNQAIELDAQFAEAWSVRSTAFSTLYNASALEDDRRAAIAEAMQSAQRAIELAPNQGHGYRARGVARINRREWLGAEDDFRVGIGRGDSPLPYARFLMSVGHLDSARTAYERVFETDPRNGRARADLPLVNEMLGDPEAADTAFEQGRQFFPGGWIGDVQWGLVRLGRGEVGPGYDPIRNVGPGFQEVWQLKEDGDTAGAVALIRRLATETPRPAAFLANYSAWAAYVGDADYALQLLDRAVAETGGGVWMYMAWLPVFADVRQLGEFHDLVRQIGLVDYWQTRSWPEMCSPLGDGDFVCS